MTNMQYNTFEDTERVKFYEKFIDLVDTKEAFLNELCGMKIVIPPK